MNNVKTTTKPITRRWNNQEMQSERKKGREKDRWMQSEHEKIVNTTNKVIESTLEEQETQRARKKAIKDGWSTDANDTELEETRIAKWKKTKWRRLMKWRCK